MMEWRKVVFAIAICLLYIPMVFMAVNTFFPDAPTNDCYMRYSYPMPAAVGKDVPQAEVNDYQRQMNVCEQTFQAEQKKYDGWKFIVIMVINILAAFVMLLNIEQSIIFGLFFGVTITAFSATIRYIEARSLIGFGLLVVLFGLIIYFVNSRKDRWVDSGSNKAQKKAR